MGLHSTSRESDSTWVDSVWTSRSDGDREMTAVATETWGLVFWHEQGRPCAAVVGPESRTSTAPVPADTEFVGIQLAVGTFLRDAPAAGLVDGGLLLPDVTGRAFGWAGRRWPVPRAEDAEDLVGALVRRGDLVRDEAVGAALRGEPAAVSARTLERRFRLATGLTRTAIGRIRRARTAADLLRAGAGVDAVVDKLGFYDEPHLARALRRHVGRTAGQLRDGTGGAVALDSVQRSTA